MIFGKAGYLIGHILYYKKAGGFVFVLKFSLSIKEGSLLPLLIFVQANWYTIYQMGGKKDESILVHPFMII
ncbi:hypothetical protein KIS4809_2624 [Bacillus sp. ZZV12-4809]|nr:hypothetical protein KIS4809_2624 [Bacillus sp. ZZV12-4809]